MDVIIRPNSTDAACLAATFIANAVHREPELVLGLATGRTMVPVYERLVTLHRDEGLNLSGVRTFNLDEYVGLGPEHEQSYRQYMNTHLFDRTNIRIEQTRLPAGTAADLAAECRLYEEDIRVAGGIDLQLLGIGMSGHIGFNEPTSSLQSRTRRTVLTRETMEQNGPLFDDPADMPESAITMGVGTILEARQCLLLITGAGKAEIAAAAIEGPMTARVTASVLQWHPDCTVILDEAAASKLELGEFYRWNWRHSPERQVLEG